MLAGTNNGPQRLMLEIRVHNEIMFLCWTETDATSTDTTENGTLECP